MGSLRLLPCHPPCLLLLLLVASAAIAGGGVRCAPVYRADYLVDGNQLVDMQYHMGPVVSGSPTNLYLIWYGRWEPAAQAVLRDFLASLSPAAGAPFPAVSDWWGRTPRMYTDQTGANVTGTLAVAGEHSDAGGTQCPGKCAYPFAAPDYGGGAGQVLRPPNGDAGVDGMVIVLGHELAELTTNPLVNAWYAGDTPTAPTEIADLCLGVYGDGGGAGGLVGNVSRAADGASYNVNGVNGRRVMVQWLWNPVRGACYGPNAAGA
uniref:Neprosin domain-containing protein n=1 Tax=Oryza brachyantha TaxID=4533 RepID=J3ML22_ORYBR